MSRNLLDDKYHPLTTKSGAAVRVMKLFAQLQEIHGIDEARRMFDQWAKPPTQSEINKLKGWSLIDRYDQMHPQNIRQLAREIEAENAALSDDEQLTPRFRPTRETIESYLRELLRQRRKEIEAGTWDGPSPLSPEDLWKF